MRIKTSVRRIAYWTGAVIDGLVIVPMLFPSIGGALWGLADFNPGLEYRYAMGVAASLMAGWTVLLIWADRKPADRKGVLLITVFPVLLGLIIAGIYAVSTGFISLGRMIPAWIMQAILMALFILGYFTDPEH